MVLSDFDGSISDTAAAIIIKMQVFGILENYF